MIKIAVFVLALVAVAAASSQTFEQWMAAQNKAYSSPRERVMRKAIWTANMKYINEFNAAGKDSYTLAMNSFGDMTQTEFRKFFLGTRMDVSKRAPLGKPHKAVTAAPASQDWRTQNAVTPVKNQGQCGSCWAFSTTGSLEGAWALQKGKLVSLSEQNLVDCSAAEGNQGCNGGLMDDAFKYIQKNKGIDTEASYPYEGRDGSCRFNAANVGANVTGYVDIKKDDENDLQNAVGTIGPVSVAIDASHPSFQFYHAGVYDPSICSSTRLDHGVLAAGYGTLNGKDYWLVKNSWGPDWGLKGYINMARNANNKCGIASAASYPTVV